MLPEEHHKVVQRALSLGRSGNPEALPELIALSRLPSNEVQRLSASAIGKLAEFGADAATAVEALVPLALHGRHPQTQQYAIRIEYWGLNTPQYKMSMYKKQTLYQQEGKRLISVYPKDLHALDRLLATKLKHCGFAARLGCPGLSKENH
jgi:hypothetical protein